MGDLQELRDQITALQAQLQNQQNVINAIPEPQQQGAPAPHVKPNQPPPFHALRSESLEAWIFQMEQYCELLPVPQANRIAFAATFLKDKAALWWRGYYQEQNWQVAPPDWNEFTDSLRRQFTPVNTSINAYDCLQRLSQKASVNAYNHEF